MAGDVVTPVVGLNIKEYTALGVRRREVDEWLERIGRKGDLWFNFWLLDESGVNLRVQRYVRGDDGHRIHDKARDEIVNETVDITVSERCPILMVRR